MALNGTNGHRIGNHLGRFLPLCLTEIILDYLSTPINLWEQNRYVNLVYEKNEITITDLEYLPISGGIVSFDWNPEGITAASQTCSFAKLAERLYPDEIKKVRKDVPVEPSRWPYGLDDRFMDHPTIRKIEIEGKVREYNHLYVQYSYELYSLYVKKSQQDEVKKIFNHNEFQFY